MSDTRKKYTKKELVTSEIHRKTGPHKVQKKSPRVCHTCMGRRDINKYVFINSLCGTCGGEGVIYE